MSGSTHKTIQGFHANYTDICEQFMTDKTFLITSEDTDYLGDGMYFWEHKSNAEYWKKTKKKDSTSSIVSAEIDLENMLDLTDDDVCEKVEKIFDNIAKKLFNFETKEFGKKMNCLFETKDFKYTVIRGREHKDNKKENSFLTGTNMTTQSIDIYCVREPDAIISRKWVQS